ncbi:MULTISPECIES: hypothetical protein [unclassified Providencia]|uniref:tail fiber/spike domain-containing protein n=1 Tax=unclassified Providencia TaxID=2633465 RepID=UPI002348F8EB|nr:MULTISPECIES: hypothetical protein [unclassified Providencia]
MREVKPTQKPVPSSDIKDLFFNSGLLDIWATSLEHKYIDRFGNCHLTAAGMEWLFKELVETFKVDMNIAILAAGYAPVGSFQEGAEVKRYNETVLWKLPDGDGEYYRWDGDLPKSVPENSTPETTGGIKSTDNSNGLWVSVGDASLRSDIKNGDGKLIGARQPYNHATYQTQHDKNSQSLTVLDWGAKEGIDSSLAAQNMIDDTGMLIVPSHFTLIAKNINLSLAKKVHVDGALKLPNGCSDFDRLLYGDNVAWLEMHINEIDGNKAGQSGQIGTHLIYLTNSPNINVHINRAKNHYYPRTFDTAPSHDGIRDDGTGCLFFYKCHNSKIGVDRLDNWGHEGLQIRDTNRTTAYLGHAQGYDGDDAYSGIQFNGKNNRLLHASVDNSAASGIGFDSTDSYAGTLISTNNRYFHGVNLGHHGSPASRTIIESVITDNAAQNGINFGGGTEGVKIKSANISNAKQYGVGQTDGAKNNWVLNSTIRNSKLAQLNIFASKLNLINSDISDKSPETPFYVLNGGAELVHEGVVFDSTAPRMMQVVSISGLSEVTVQNGNIRQNSMPKIYPSTSNAAQVLLYVSAVADGTMTVKTASGNAAPSGSFFRYQII